MTLVSSVLFVVIGYLIGTVPTGLLVARARGVDLRKLGSGNIGATNVLRSMGVGPAVIVALGDPIKGVLAVGLPMAFGMPEWTLAVSGFAAVLGNDFNMFLGFGGGKGIATTTGVFMMINPLAASVAFFLGIFTIALGRLVSLGSMVAVVAAPILVVVAGPFPASDLVLALGLMTLGFVKHVENLRRLAKGTERRLGDRAGPK